MDSETVPRLGALRMNAYVLAADPHYLAASVASYYDLVERIVVSYDADHLSWSGHPVPVEECRAELASIDHAGKLDFRPGRFSAPGTPPTEMETKQRQAALDAASGGCDWVLQFDGDEVLPSAAAFSEMVIRADGRGCEALLYPSRWLYGKAADGRWLEASTRWWRPAAGYPGPLAVKAGTRLTHARQTDRPAYRVDFRSTNTDPFRSKADEIHATVPVDLGVLHFSWARDEGEMRAKAVVNSHGPDFDWNAAIDRWKWRLQHPRRTVLGTPARSKTWFGQAWLRSTHLPIEPAARVAS